MFKKPRKMGIYVIDGHTSLQYHCEMGDFEWNENKNKNNREKHAIDFNQAIVIFNDENLLELPVHKNEEHRIMAIGKIEGVIITLIYTLRKAVYRVISARRSHKNERKSYESNITT